MKSALNRKNNHRLRWMILSFGLLMLLFVSSKDARFPSEWNGMHSKPDCKLS
jgi:hypothetical protein